MAPPEQKEQRTCDVICAGIHPTTRETSNENNELFISHSGYSAFQAKIRSIFAVDITLRVTMSDTPRYPEENEIKVEWSWLHVSIVLLSVLVIWPVFYFALDPTINITNKLLSVLGLNIDIFGVVLASLKTPFYGIFHDGGKIEILRANAERKYFQLGMWLIAVGFFLQALGTLL